MFLKLSTCCQLLRALHSRTCPIAILRNNSRCLSIISQQRWRNVAYGNRNFSQQIFEGPVSVSVTPPTCGDVCFRRVHHAHSSARLLPSRWFSGSSFDCMPRNQGCQNGARFSTSAVEYDNTDVVSSNSSVLKTKLYEPAQIDGGKESDEANDEGLTNETSHNVGMATENQVSEKSRDSTSENKITVNSALVNADHEESELDVLDDHDEVDILAEQDTPMVMEEFIKPLLPSESFTLAAYADHSATLQKLVELGVDLSKVEKKANIRNALIKMEFDKHMKETVIFLHDVGISGDVLGRFLTINPFVLTEELQNLEARIQYLRGKSFTEDAITQVLTRAPYFISFSVERVDSKLGFYQKELSLTGDELRQVITKTPKLVTFKVQHIKENLFLICQQLGFSKTELKKLVLEDPSVLLRGKMKLIGAFDLLHNRMGIPHKQLVKNSKVFNGRVFRLQERHQFLKKLGRDQYDPTQPGFVSVINLSKLPDDVFAQEIAMSSINEYNAFLKTI